MKKSAVVVQKWTRRYLAGKAAERRRNAAETIRKLV